MNKVHQEYELNILKKVINEHLDEVVPGTEEGLNHLLSQQDNTVWNIATKIYSQSGYKVEFSFIHEVVNSWIEVLKKRIATEKAKRVEQARIEAERQLQLIENPVEITRTDYTQTEIFEKVKRIIIEQLSVESDRVTLSSHISDDLGADECDTRELAMALEEEFDDFEIEIPDDILGSENNYQYDYRTHQLSWCLSGDGYRPVACTVGELLNYIYQQISEQES